MSNWALPEINLEKCDRCGVCVQKCPTRTLAMVAVGPVFNHPQACTYCTDCEALCPQHAISCAFEIVWQSQTPYYTRRTSNE